MEKEMKDFLLNVGISKGRIEVHFTDDEKVNEFINDVKNYPHAYVLACFMDRQVQAERAWRIPYEIKDELQDFSIKTLLSVSLEQYEEIFEKRNLHRFNNTMAGVFYNAVQRIHEVYNDDISQIWKDKPGSAEVVNKFMEFDGVGIKIATMTANILVRQFGIELSEYHFIDVSPDVHVRKVLQKLGLINPGASTDQVIGVAREIDPDYPGIVDGFLWKVGRDYCSKGDNPKCKECYLNSHCRHYLDTHPGLSE